MKRRMIVLFTIQYCLLFVASAQDAAPNKSLHFFGIHTGYSRHLIRDEVASPLIYKGTQAPFVFTYNNNRRESRQTFTFYVDNLELNSSITDKSGYYLHYADNLNVLLAYSYNRKAFSINPIHVDCFLGVKFSGILNYRNFHYSKDYTMLFAEQINSIGMNLILEKKNEGAKDGYLRFNLNVPFVAYAILNNRYNAVVSETFDKIDFSKNVAWQAFSHGEVVSISKLAAFQTELSYARFFTKHIGIEIEHRLNFYYFSHYKDFLYARSLNNQFLVGLIVKL